MKKQRHELTLLSASILLRTHQPNSTLQQIDINRIYSITLALIRKNDFGGILNTFEKHIQ
ncbi:hypothetical protein AF72_10565 [Xylella taiwanensis]|uniref:Uncharacterized protein n=1 Tax=Xylella taiwanensis TaxID=1444770 RepID=Z9JHS3_9GAMM|nr:hypothetical protein AB672_05495 [Xylella taiwanensis]EWS77513.1 hypothetical protein AF72_10565 [Xylella taiwanensis]